MPEDRDALHELKFTDVNLGDGSLQIGSTGDGDFWFTTKGEEVRLCVTIDGSDALELVGFIQSELTRN